MIVEKNMEFSLSKDDIRRRIWFLMEEKGVARFPRPVYGRIPNFAGSEVAAQKLAEQREFKQAKVVKVNPDSPQKMVRYLTLISGKTLIMPTPKLKHGFLLLNPNEIPKSALDSSFKIDRLK
jgi:5-formyltetrahydrofolate cyclo-ligase